MSMQHYWYVTNKIPRINWLHPLAYKLKFFAYPMGRAYIDLVSGKIGTVTGTAPPVKVTKYGSARFFSAGRVRFSSINHGIGTGAMTMWTRFRWDGNAASYSSAMSLATNVSLYVPNDATNKNLAVDTTVGGQGTVVYSATNAVVSGTWADYSVAFGGSSTSSTGYINGAAKTTSSSLSYSNLGTSTDIDLGDGQGSEYAHGDTKYALLWARKLSESEEKYLTDFGPESLFIQPQEFLYFGSVTAGSITGTGAGTLASVTGSATGAIELTGTGAGALSAITGASTGTFYGLFTGTAAGELAAVTGSASGTFSTGFAGTGAGTLAAATGSATGVLKYTGTAAGDLAAVIGSSSGTFYGAFTGTGAGTLAAITGSATGSFTDADFFGTGAGTLSAATGSATGVLKYSGAGSGALSAVTGSSAGIIEITGTGAGTFEAVIGSSSGTYAGNVTGTVSGLLRAITASASGSNGETVFGQIFMLKADKYNFRMTADRQKWSLN